MGGALWALLKTRYPGGAQLYLGKFWNSLPWKQEYIQQVRAVLGEGMRQKKEAS